MRRVLGLLASLCAMETRAAVEGPGQELFIHAAPAQDRIFVDGKLDEVAWAAAPVFDAFVQRFPNAGAAPSERTELRVLYGADYVYFGIIAHDSRPARIDRRLGRRDSFPTTDAVRLIIDSTHDHRTAYFFYLSAGGVQGDGLFFDDRNSTADWDGIWDGEVGTVEDGWVAEFAIPLSLLRFPGVPMQTWGFSLRREIARLNEEIDSVDNPRTSNATVSRLGHLTGLEGLKPRRAVELVPYLATRGILRPQFSDSSRPTPRLMEPILDLGLDLKTALTSDLTLNATLNPDFGQVEADQLILNLTTFETFFPEKRPFFTQGLELFQPVGSKTAKDVPQSLFYSRRIGLQTPILGAAKLTGTVMKGVEVGLLNALVTGPWQPQDEERPDRKLGLHASRPLHLGPGSSLPSTPQPATNFLAAVARGSVGENSRIGGSFVAATPMVSGCTEAQAVLAEQPTECLGRGGLGAAADFDIKTSDSEYGVLGQVDASRTLGGPPSRTLQDGTVLGRGAAGYGGYLRAGKFGGEGFRWDVGYDFSSPTLDLNATGYQRTQNEHAPRLSLRYERPNGLSVFKGFFANVSGASRWTTDGRHLNRGSSVNSSFVMQLPSFDFVGLEAGMDLGGYDIRELDSTGIPLEQESSGSVVLFLESNGKRAVGLSGYAVASYHELGPAPSAWGAAGNLGVSLRPHPALETRLEVSGERTPLSTRMVANLGESHFLLGTLETSYLSLTLRQQWIIQSRLTLQGYAQVFSAHGRFSSFFEGSSDAARTPIRFSAMTPMETQAPPFEDVALNLNMVLRWEYRLGSTVFLVYMRSQQGLPGPATDAVMLKWNHYWEL